jgi:prophage antirepressor-like protein
MLEYTNEELGKIRVEKIALNPFFYAIDICRILGKEHNSAKYTRECAADHIKQIKDAKKRKVNLIDIDGAIKMCDKSNAATAKNLRNLLRRIHYDATYLEPAQDGKISIHSCKEKQVEEKPVEEIPLAKANRYVAKEPILMEEVKQELEEHEEIKEEETMESNAMKIFHNSEFGDIRTEVINNEVWFVGKDVAEILGYGNTRDALGKHVDEEDKNTVAIYDGIKGNPNQVVINESGLYSLILSSKLPSAKRFKHWVTSEVLPSIRKTGSYQKPDQAAEPLNTFEQIRLLATGTTELAQQVTHLSEEVTELKTDMPLYGCEIDEVQQHVKRKGVQCLGGKDSEAYADGSIRSQVYKDIYSQLKREYGCVSTYKSIKRKYIADVHDFIDCYQLPTVLEEQITAANAQQRLF